MAAEPKPLPTPIGLYATILRTVAEYGIPPASYEMIVVCTTALRDMALAAERAKDEGCMHEPVASELDIEMEEMLRASVLSDLDARREAISKAWKPMHTPPPSAHGGAPPVIPPAGVYGNKVLEDGDPKASKVGVFYAKNGSTWFSVEGTTSFSRTMADENWTFMGWLELRSVP
jgi:hypothetical protein